MLTDKLAPPFYPFLFWFQPQNIFLVRDLIFLLRLSTHASNTGGELLYYNLYHEEAPLYMYLIPPLFNSTFVFFWFRLTITNNDSTYLVLYFIQKYVNGQEIFETNKMDDDKIYP